MSHQSELHQKDVLVSTDPTIVVSSSDASSNVNRIHEHQPTIPSGEVIDGKNTLQSFDSMDRVPVSSSNYHIPRSFRSGEAIDGRNAIQVFNSSQSGDTKQTSTDSLFESTNLFGSTNPTVFAVAVEAEPEFDQPVNNVVPVEAQSDVNRPLNNYVEPVNNVTVSSWRKCSGSTILVMLAIFAVSVSAGLGLYFGLIDESSESSVKDINTNSSPTPSPITRESGVPTLEIESATPTLLSMNTKASVLTSFINNISLSNQAITFDGTSPESVALAWMISNDLNLDNSVALNSLDTVWNSTIGFRIKQRFPLLVMWFQQGQTVKWARSDRWLGPTECDWYGIVCETVFDEISNSNQNAVAQISFEGTSSYVGTFPSDIGLLTHLTRFEVRDTFGSFVGSQYLQGTLPESIGQWTSLTYFDVFYNNLSGELPSTIGKWSLLTYFNASSNYFKGTLPESIGNWSSLAYFDISYFNDFTGMLPDSIGRWTGMKYFSTINNAFFGALPESLSNWTALANFEVVNNDFTGTLPEYIGKWTSLTSFDVSGNDFRGTLPDIIGDWTRMNYFDVNYNDMSRSIPHSISQWTDIKYFRAINNSLTGTLPESIGQMTDVIVFAVGNNLLNGSIPFTIGNWSSIGGAYFYQNQFTGTVPDVICDFIAEDGDFLEADCLAEVNCTCCTTCF